jgi:hypothetical protein
LTTINRTNVAIAIDGRPRPRAEPSHAAATGPSSAGSKSTRSSLARSSGSSRASIGSTSSHNDSTCPADSVSITPPSSRKTMHEQVNRLKRAGQNSPF